jgi:hypothetical protein
VGWGVALSSLVEIECMAVMGLVENWRNEALQATPRMMPRNAPSAARSKHLGW